MIPGLQFLELKTQVDERGFFREILRPDTCEPRFSVGQLSHSLVHTGVTKGWHGHRSFSQFTYFAVGSAVVVFTDRRRDSVAFGSYQERIVSEALPAWAAIHPPGVLLAYRCTQGPAHVFYTTTGTYDPNEEIRQDLEGGTLDYDWSKWTKAR